MCTTDDVGAQCVFVRNGKGVSMYKWLLYL